MESVVRSWDQNHLVLKKAIASSHHPYKMRHSGRQDFTLGFHPAQFASSEGGFKSSFSNKHRVVWGFFFYHFIIFLHASGSNSPTDLALADDRPSDRSTSVAKQALP